MVGYTISGWKTLDPVMREGEGTAGAFLAISLEGGARWADADFFFAGWNYGMKVGGEVTPETPAPSASRSMHELTESCIHTGRKLQAPWRTCMTTF